MALLFIILGLCILCGVAWLWPFLERRNYLRKNERAFMKARLILNGEMDFPSDRDEALELMDDTFFGGLPMDEWERLLALHKRSCALALSMASAECLRLNL